MRMGTAFNAITAQTTTIAAAMAASGADTPATLLVSGGLALISGGLAVAMLRDNSDDNGSDGPTGPAVVTA